MTQYMDFSHASTSRKWTHKRQQGEGFDAPRNSMEFSMEAPHSYGVFQEDVPYSCNMRQYPKASSPIKKLIHEDISFRPNEGHKRTPSVIARLMGMDSPPLHTTTELTSNPDERRQEIITKPMPRRERDPAEMISTKHVSFVQHKNPIKHAPKQEIRAYDDDNESKMVLGQLSKKSNGGADQWSKPQPREHPQEEELQKFKKDFEAWQASRVWEQARTLESGSHVAVDDDDDERCSEIVPYRYQQQHTGRDHANKHVNAIDDVHWRRRRSKDGGASISGSRTFSLTSADDGSTRLPLSRFYREEEERPLSPTSIVILKPCPELSADDVEESSLGSPELMKKENNMEAFLEEVKMRLKFELGGSMSANDGRAADRWASGDVPAADPKQIARSIANQIRETVTKDLHPALLRSESTRSYRGGDVQSQMDYVCRDARKQLSDRLRNVLRREPETEPPCSHRRRAASTTASSFDEEPRPKPPRRDVARKGNKKIRSKEEKKRVIESSDVRSFRHGYKNSAAPTAGDPDDHPASPRNLMRSFSAPVSGSATFVKLLSEEPRVLTGARLQRRHEGHGSNSRAPSPSPSPATEERQKGRKDAFSIKGRVSNLRQNLGLRGKLFGKKLHSAADESPSSSFLDDLPPIGTLVTAPSVLIHPGLLQENSTEVPPSPASWCSSPPDEMMIRGGYPSPVSPLEASFSEHRSPLKPPASSTPSEPGNPSSEQAQTEQLAEISPALQHYDDDGDDDTAEMDDPMKAFIRAVLVAAGMYGPSKNSDHSFSSCQPKQIPKWVFEEVSSSFSAPASDADEVATVDHRLLFDLINEALPRAVHGSATALSRTFSKWYATPRSAPGGKRLLDGLCRSVQARLEPPSDDVDGLIGRDLSASPWSGVFHGDVDGLVEEVEAEMLDELVEETVWDVLLNVGD